MASVTNPCLIVLALLVGTVWSGPALHHNPEAHQQLSELSARLAARAQRDSETRLPLPSPQEVEAIKKVAQILVMLGEQVIPTIIGEPPSSGCDGPEVPNDVVDN